MEAVEKRSVGDGALIMEGLLPEWWNAYHQKAWERFRELPMPARKDEDWRFSSVREITLEGFSCGGEVSEQVIDEVKSLSGVTGEEGSDGGKAVFVNDQCVFFQGVSEELQDQGVIWKPLMDAVRDHEELVKASFCQWGEYLGTEKFAKLHEAHVSAGIFLYVPKGVEVEMPLACHHWIAGEEGWKQAAFPHTLVVAEAGSKVQAVDFFPILWRCGGAGLFGSGFTCG